MHTYSTSSICCGILLLLLSMHSVVHVQAQEFYGHWCGMGHPQTYEIGEANGVLDEIDAVCRRHDYCYIDTNQAECDRIFIQEMNQVLKDYTWTEQQVNSAQTMISMMSMKLALGMFTNNNQDDELPSPASSNSHRELPDKDASSSSSIIYQRDGNAASTSTKPVKKTNSNHANKQKKNTNNKNKKPNQEEPIDLMSILNNLGNLNSATQPDNTASASTTGSSASASSSSTSGSSQQKKKTWKPSYGQKRDDL